MFRPRLVSSVATTRTSPACMCASGEACSSAAPGHGVHLIQTRIAAARSSEWLDGVVTAVDPASGEVTLSPLAAGDPLRLWAIAFAGATNVTVGDPVALHESAHLLAAGTQRVNVAVL